MQSPNHLFIIDNNAFSQYNSNASKSKPVTLYFLLDKSKASLLTNARTASQENEAVIKSQCEDVKVVSDKKYIKLTWENLNGLGTDEQKIAINAFRLNYVKDLKKHIEGTNQTKIICCVNTASCPIDSSCKLEGVGTTENISAASDIDMNFYFTFTPTNIDEIINNIRSLYDKINTFHYNKFTTPYEDLFDMHFYATNLYSKECNNSKCKINNCSKDTCVINNNYDTNKQRRWAFYRAAEIIQNNTLENLINLYNETHPFRKLYNDTLKVIKEQEQSKRTNNTLQNSMSKKYVNSVAESYKNLNLKIDINSFSRAKIYERETYRSVGAFLHIVAKKTDLKYNLYIDSMLDNYGFILENLYHEPSCFKLDIQIKLLRVAKYLERMCDAIILYFTDIYNLNSNSFKLVKPLYDEVNELRKVSNIINSNRKNNKDSTNELNNLSYLLKNFNKTYKDTDIKDNTPLKDLDENKWSERITSIFNTIPLFYNPIVSKSNGGSLNKIRILGRLRNITVINKKKYITYKKEKILLSDARKLDKK